MDPITAMMLGSGMGGSSSAASGFGGALSAWQDGSGWTVATNGGRAEGATITRTGDPSSSPLTGAIAGAMGGADWTLLALAALGAIVAVRVLRRGK
jgi:hypothetical protein